MAKLERASDGRMLFAPLIFRLALKVEQVTWSEFAGSASEAVYVLRAARNLFKLDVLCPWLDTWLEAEAAGSRPERDDLGMVGSLPSPAANRPAVETVLAAPPIALAVELVRRLNAEAGDTLVNLGAMSAGATLIERLGGAAARERIVARNAKDLDAEDAALLAYARDIGVGLARAYCEAGAGALLLLQEAESPDLAELAAFAPVLNLADYYAVPVVLACRHALSAQGLAVAERITRGLYVTPSQAGAAIAPLGEQPKPHGAWLALSRWEIDPQTAPEDVAAWRRLSEAA